MNKYNKTNKSIHVHPEPAACIPGEQWERLLWQYAEPDPLLQPFYPRQVLRTIACKEDFRVWTQQDEERSSAAWSSPYNFVIYVSLLLLLTAWRQAHVVSKALLTTAEWRWSCGKHDNAFLSPAASEPFSWSCLRFWVKRKQLGAACDFI